MECDPFCDRINGCLNNTSDRWKRTQNYLYDRSLTAIDRIPKILQYYCCCVCCYRKRKSIDDISNKNKFSNNNNSSSSSCTPIIPLKLANDINKPQQQVFTTDHHFSHNNYIIRENHNSNYNPDPEEHNVERSRTPYSENRFISPALHNKIQNRIDSNTNLDKSNHVEPIGNASSALEESSEISSSEEHSSRNSTPTRKAAEKSTPSIKSQSRPSSTYQNTSTTVLPGTVTSTPSLSTKTAIDTEIVSNRPPSSFSNKYQEESKDTIDHADKNIVQEAVNDIEDDSNGNDNDGESQTFDEPDEESMETVIVTTPKQEELKNHIETQEEESKSENIELPIVDSENNKPSSAPSPIPTVEVKPMSRPSSNLAKSYESIYESSPIRQDIDIRSTASTGSSSDYPPSVAASLDCPISKTNGYNATKPQQVPLLRKSKTTLFGSRLRRVSPIKQSMKLTKTEHFPQTLLKFDKPKDGLNLAVQQLESSNWETVMDGLVSMVRLMRFHPEHLDIHIHMVCLLLAKTVKNLRSQVARAACQASTEFFSVRNKFLEQECDDLVGNLLNRTADTNRFLRADATRALESMCDNLTPPKILHLLTTRGALHQNAVVRTATSKLMNRLIDRLGCERIFSMNRENREKVFLTGANLLLEGSLETRNYAKAIFRTLSDHPNYNRSILEFVPTRTYRNIEKSLKSIR